MLLSACAQDGTVTATPYVMHSVGSGANYAGLQFEPVSTEGLSPSDIRSSPHVIDAELEFINVIVNPVNSPTKTFYITYDNEFLKYFAPKWKKAIADSIGKLSLFKSSSPNKLVLSVTILNSEHPAMIFLSDKAITMARYQIMDRATNHVIFSKDITSTGVDGWPVSLDQWGGPVAFDNSIRMNIREFCASLSAENLCISGSCTFADRFP